MTALALRTDCERRTPPTRPSGSEADRGGRKDASLTNFMQACNLSRLEHDLKHQASKTLNADASQNLFRSIANKSGLVFDDQAGTVQHPAVFHYACRFAARRFISLRKPMPTTPAITAHDEGSGTVRCKVRFSVANVDSMIA